MTGADIIGALLRADIAISAVVPIDRIRGGRLPDDVSLPALLVRTVSSIERPALRRGAAVSMTDRIAVTVRARSYDEQIEVMDAVLRCCAGRTGAIAGASAVAILNAGRGPDVIGPGDSYEQTQDFRVSYAKAG